MAQKYGSYDNVIFEIFNEPLCMEDPQEYGCSSSSWTSWSVIKSYAEEVISVIRQYSDNLILVGTPKYSQDVDVAASSKLTCSKCTNLAYVLHFYADTHTLDGWEKFRNKINSAMGNGVPIFVSEYGTTNSDGGQVDANHYDSHNASNSDEWHEFLDNNKISSCAWQIDDKKEAAAFFGTGTKFDMSGSWTNTSYMTPSGQYIFNKLRSYANSAPWRTGSAPAASSSSSSNEEEDDYGEPCGGYCMWPDGCFELRSDPEGRYNEERRPQSCSNQIVNCSHRYEDASCTDLIYW